MGRLKAVAINESANLCSEKESQEPMPCCEDISQHLKVEEITKASFDFDSQPDLVELAIVSWILSDFVSIHDEDGNPQFQYYSPPPPGINYQVDYQVYLI